MSDSQEISWARELIELSFSYRAARVVQTAHSAGLFEALGQGAATADALAGRLKLDAGMTEKVLIACAAMDLVDRSAGGWNLSEKGRTTLLPDAPLYQGNVIAHMADVWAFWNDLEPHLRGQKGASEFLENGARARSHRDFILAMHNLAAAGRAAELADCVALEGRRKLIDVGGGPGTYTIALCERFPDLHGVVFDLPETLDVAREVITRYGMEDRVETMPGNWDEDEFGSGFDAVLMSNVLHGPGSGAAMKLEKAHRALNPGGLLIVQDFMLNRRKTGPLAPALFNLMVGAFSVDELSEHIQSAGFVEVQRQCMPADLGTTLLIAEKT